MKHSLKKQFILLLFIPGGASLSFAQLPDQGDMEVSFSAIEAGKVFYEIVGMVSMEAEHASFINGWSKAVLPFDTQSMEADSAFTWKGGVMRFDIEFTQPGKYAVWILARKGRRGRYAANDVKVWPDRDLFTGLIPSIGMRSVSREGLIDADGYQTIPDPDLNINKRESELNIPENYYTWSSKPKDGKGPAFWNVNKPGKHHIEFVIGEEWQYAIDKIVLTLDNQNPPWGRGPAETISRNSTPFREGLDDNIILPPAWAFGILYGGYTNQQESLERVKSIIDHDYPIDGYWIDSWFWNFTEGGRGPGGYINFRGDSISFPDPGFMWSEMQKVTVKSGIWIWDIINRNGNEKVFDEFLEAGAFEYIFQNRSGWHNFGGKSEAGQINFSDPAAVEYFQFRLKPLFDQGLDFLKLDRNPNVPFAKGCFEATQKFGKETGGRGFIIQHVGGLADPEFKRYPTKWSGVTAYINISICSVMNFS